jgi:hypothetical protein
MSGAARKPSGLEEYAKAHGLEYAKRIDLPKSGGLLEEDDLSVQGAAAGLISGKERGALCYLHYTYRSDDHTHEVDKTAAVVRVPESIGFLPYLASGGNLIVGRDTKTRELDGGVSVRVSAGANDAWLTELFSPAFSEWLSRNPDGFGWELCDGVLCASRDGHIADATQLQSLCDDTEHIAATIREQCLQEVDTGEARRTAAKTTSNRKIGAKLSDAILARTTFDNPPADIQSAQPQFRHILVRHPTIYFNSLWITLLIMIGVNIIAGGLYGLLLNLGNPGQAVIIYQVILFVIIFPLVLRSQINGISSDLATNGFWSEYIRTRHLTEEDPSSFAATHAKANLPGAPIKVLTGDLAGVQGSLMITGDGSERGDVIALVAGEAGPTASAPFDVSAPGISTTALDSYTKRLADEIHKQQGSPAPAPTV